MRSLFRSKFRVTQPYSVNPEYYAKFGLKGHEGGDYVPIGTSWDILALENGVVVRDIDDAAMGKNYGKNITVWHPNIRKATQYCHMASNSVKLGDTVTRGQVIGVMGDTGNVTGAHVHLNLFDVDENGVRLNRDNGFMGGIDPLPFLNEDVTDVPVDIVTVSLAQRDDWELKKTWWNNVRALLDIEDSWTVAEQEIKALLEYKEKVVVNEGKLEVAQSHITQLEQKIEGLSKENFELGLTVTEMTKKHIELDNGYKDALLEIDGLKRDLAVPDTGWVLIKKGIQKLFGWR